MKWQRQPVWPSLLSLRLYLLLLLLLVARCSLVGSANNFANSAAVAKATAPARNDSPVWNWIQSKIQFLCPLSLRAPSFFLHQQQPSNSIISGLWAWPPLNSTQLNSTGRPSRTARIDFGAPKLYSIFAHFLFREKSPARRKPMRAGSSSDHELALKSFRLLVHFKENWIKNWPLGIVSWAFSLIRLESKRFSRAAQSSMISSESLCASQ